MARVVKNPSGYRSKGRNGVEKAQQFGLYAKSHGWSGKYHLEDGIVYLFARRGESETIEIWWSEAGKALPEQLPIYTLAGEKIKLRNVSAAAVRVANEPDMSRLRKATRKARRQLENAAPVPEEIDDYIASMTGTLPFDHESTDAEIKAALKGRTITWVNRRTGQLDSAIVSDNPKQFKVVRKNKPYVDFVYPVQRTNVIETYGFRSVYLDSIVSVA
ncbi:hypothetical protein SEA_LEOPARD_63 [Mycobacterium phage Leopard]|uniref:Uncharacterized protein n=1 Tax=Mycobacterium phage Onyinye TaxID=2686235 RepID=A0A6B9LJE5_9CAUD|nr:hypothetical protein PP339_gp064 [Mycobacterium phage Onyinye]QHB37469.1 hypothetical protein SEA_ONYINYE_64 [Mycobacterium phage Onyinye]UOW92940.1 hypothetical protein SEA_LEOPARD_63 [Mycobacterium phage Leopard]WKW85226.1 hypothetical protein SEA_AIKOY__64 [Mycobacterium phage Aikoy]